MVMIRPFVFPLLVIQKPSRIPDVSNLGTLDPTGIAALKQAAV